MQAEHNAREMAALAAAAQQDKALLEARMHTQEESFQNEANWMAMETQLVGSNVIQYLPWCQTRPCCRYAPPGPQPTTLRAFSCLS